MKHQILNLHLPKAINAKNAQIPQLFPKWKELARAFEWLFPFWKHSLTKEGR